MAYLLLWCGKLGRECDWGAASGRPFFPSRTVGMAAEGRRAYAYGGAHAHMRRAGRASWSGMALEAPEASAVTVCSLMDLARWRTVVLPIERRGTAAACRSTGSRSEASPRPRSTVCRSVYIAVRFADARPCVCVERYHVWCSPSIACAWGCAPVHYQSRGYGQGNVIEE